MKKELRDFIQYNRRQFMNAPFNEGDVKDNAIEQFSEWFENAVKAGLKDPYAFTLATASKNGIPSARVVYMRDISQDGLIFYSNYSSHKGNDLAHNPYASANFYWEDLSRQIRFSGKVEKIPTRDSDAYFSTRPRESQLGAWASFQSEKLKNREELISRLEEQKEKFKGQDVPRPDFWGGYRLIPSNIEFWQGRESRLHDRIHYQCTDSRSWKITRLSP